MLQPRVPTPPKKARLKPGRPLPRKLQSRRLPRRLAYETHYCEGQVNQDDCGVCISLTMYCLFFGFNYHTIPPHLFHNQARLFMFYTVMGYHFNVDEDEYNNSMDLDGRKGIITIVEDISPPAQYNDDCNRYERKQQLQKKIHLPWSENS
jgi:hypothetical protein